MVAMAVMAGALATAMAAAKEAVALLAGAAALLEEAGAARLEDLRRHPDCRPCRRVGVAERARAVDTEGSNRRQEECTGRPVCRAPAAGRSEAASVSAAS